MDVHKLKATVRQPNDAVMQHDLRLVAVLNGCDELGP